jgi:hypothetical protein
VSADTPLGREYPSSAPPADSSVGELIGQVSRDLSTLIRQEMALARAEAQQTARRVGKGAGMLAGAAWSAQLLMLFLSLALWWALGVGLGDGPEAPDLGLSGLVVALVWALIAGVLALVGRGQLKKAPGLPQTTETVSKIPQALKGQEPS